MSKKSFLSPWTCTRCLRQQKQRFIRQVSTTSRVKAVAAASVASDEPSPVFNTHPSLNHDDRTLRQIFDSAAFWEEHSLKSRRQHTRSRGLFQNRYLTQPEGFQQFTEISLAKCQRVVAAVLEYKSIEQYRRITRDLDRLSDLLCRVIDLADFVRAVHPDRRFQHAAHQSYAQMFEYMNVLNTTPKLNEQLKTAAAMPEVWDSWTEEERAVAKILIQDFSKSAIDMHQSKREAFVKMSNEIVDAGQTFVDNISAARPALALKSSDVLGMWPPYVKELTRWGTVTLPTTGSAATAALQSVENANVRREVYMASRTAAKDNIYKLEVLLRRRAELAKLAGFESYAHMTLSEKMAGSPEAVSSFLDAIAEENAPRVRQELQMLSELKLLHTPNHDPSINAWDREYYAIRVVANRHPKTRNPDFLSAYFSLGTVMQGLSRLYHRLYGIRLVPRETFLGETWNADVRCIDIIDDREGHIGVMYCDLFERDGKSPNPAHFTLRCSRKISDEELQEGAAVSAAYGDMFASASEAASDGLATAVNKDDGSVYQLPTIALICDFAVNKSKNRPALLTFREMRTLWHEMGHALHSICGRTQLQNVAGTRCATDFAELPSVLNESFASAPEVLSLWARHWETDEPLDVSRISSKVELHKRMEGSEIESQVLHSILDQRCHSALPLSWSQDGADEPSSAIYQDVWRQYCAVPEPSGTSWQGFFGHLFGYGATYYSYLFDRAIAGKIFKDVFQRTSQGALDPEAGHRYREEILRWGGGRSGWKCVGGLLGGEEGELISHGGKDAMKRVGTWGVRDSWGS